MYAITGITGKVGSIVANTLLAAGLPVRAVVRDAEKGKAWAAKGCEVAIASSADAHAMAKAFAGTAGVFFMTPPNFDPEPGFPESVKIVTAVAVAIEQAKPGKVVFLSTVGAHVAEPNLLNNSKLTEEGLRKVSVPVALLRAAWFMENAAWDVAAARNGVIHSFLQPLDHKIPMVSTQDIGHTIADLLRETWSGTRVIELEGPQRYSANDVAAAFAKALGHPVSINPVPRDTWETLFQSQGMQFPMPRIRMLDGFNEGWIDFEGNGAEKRNGITSIDAVLGELS
ncbi:NmrA family NAD(P)-binding protein [Herminiimonas aquatilis]|uniref:NmrA family NAD(P)-binding protein n=1 Tax=Herminiimonas aquatilis TaxID=345342 RepID=A0ABW2J449_9BURK